MRIGCKIMRPYFRKVWVLRPIWTTDCAPDLAIFDAFMLLPKMAEFFGMSLHLWCLVLSTQRDSICDTWNWDCFSINNTQYLRFSNNVCLFFSLFVIHGEKSMGLFIGLLLYKRSVNIFGFPTTPAYSSLCL
jgi:hypothetical protein